MELNGGQTNNAPTSTGAQHTVPHFGNGGGMSDSHASANSKKVIVAVIIAVAIIVVGGLALWGWKTMGSASSFVKSDKYQALFLTNGQVYFGKLSNVDDKYVKLDNIYYLQVQQSVQPADKNSSSNPQVSLAKLGSELHGPDDTMLVNRDQVLFWENLKDDGRVVQAIKSNK
jgi:uncharacterized protein YxeA